MENISVGKLTLVEIVQRLKNFEEHEAIKYQIYEKEDDHNIGAIKAYEQIIDDLVKMNEKEFIEKYLTILSKLDSYFENADETDEKVEFCVGYNNAVVDVMKIINPKYQYADGI